MKKYLTKIAIVFSILFLIPCKNFAMTPEQKSRYESLRQEALKNNKQKFADDIQRLIKKMEKNPLENKEMTYKEYVSFLLKDNNYYTSTSDSDFFNEDWIEGLGNLKIKIKSEKISYSLISLEYSLKDVADERYKENPNWMDMAIPFIYLDIEFPKEECNSQLINILEKKDKMEKSVKFNDLKEGMMIREKIKYHYEDIKKILSKVKGELLYDYKNGENKEVVIYYHRLYKKYVLYNAKDSIPPLFIKDIENEKIPVYCKYDNPCINIKDILKLKYEIKEIPRKDLKKGDILYDFGSCKVIKKVEKYKYTDKKGKESDRIKVEYVEGTTEKLGEQTVKEQVLIKK